MLRPDLAPIDVYLADAMLLGPDAFVARHPWPMLVIAEPDWSQIGPLTRPDTLGPGAPLPALLELIDPANSGASLDALCLALRPLEGGPPRRIRLGRSPDVDVVLLHETVSKLHAELSWDGVEATLTDRGARNGTSIEGVRAPPDVPLRLDSGALVAFGTLATRFYSPRGFLSWLVSGASRAGAVRMRP